MKGKTYKLNLNKFAVFVAALATMAAWVWLVREILLGLAGM